MATEPYPTQKRPPSPGLLASMRIRKKLMVLHTAFSLALAAVLLLSLHPTIAEVVKRAELDEASLILQGKVSGVGLPESDDRRRVEVGTEDGLGLSPALAALARSAPDPIPTMTPDDRAALLALEPGSDRFIRVSVRIPEARLAVWRLYGLVTVALLAVYFLVAGALEAFVLPRHVYRPIRRILDADRALQQGNQDEELIPASAIPADELGEIMLSRNDSVRSLRQHEAELSVALSRLEEVANDLKRKNHLLETARRNLADADRLASLGMMSAGIAHELNTPLTVVKGLAEKLDVAENNSLSPAEARLLVRVVGRLERLGESLLDFARVRQPETSPARLAVLVDEAATLVRLDRNVRVVTVENTVPPELVCWCDADRMVQVLVNLIRNAVDAIVSDTSRRSGRVEVVASLELRDAKEFVRLRILDDGPGIDPRVLTSLFEPFVSAHLDSRGTGLGLAVAQGIIEEHSGLILARNREGSPGAEFEVILPRSPETRSAPQAPQAVDSAR